MARHPGSQEHGRKAKGSGGGPFYHMDGPHVQPQGRPQLQGRAAELGLDRVTGAGVEDPGGFLALCSGMAS